MTYAIVLSFCMILSGIAGWVSTGNASFWRMESTAVWGMGSTVAWV
jgi:hypothetical protein